MPISGGTRFGPYEVLAPLGAGGMGEVFKATDTRLDRLVAIKVLTTAAAGDPEFRARFTREAKSISQLHHSNICVLHDVGREGDVDYLVMEYLEGETLAQRLDRGALPLSQALVIAAEIAAALTRAHQFGIVHRDLKPGNVMLTKDGAKLLDFGLAKSASKAGAGNLATELAVASPAGPVTARGTVLGTVQYMSPEQIQGQDADARSDIFSFGCVLYEMVTGTKPASGSGQDELLLESKTHDYVNDWSKDGRFLLYSSPRSNRGFDLFTLDMATRQSSGFLETTANEDHATFSPDGRWVAYSSTTTGREEVFVRSFPATGGQYRVSRNGGMQTAWRGDGRELYFLALDGTLMAAEISTAQGFESSVPRALFKTTAALGANAYRRQFAVTKDGQRFLVNIPAVTAGQSLFTVLVNWPAAVVR